MPSVGTIGNGDGDGNGQRGRRTGTGTTRTGNGRRTGWAGLSTFNLPTVNPRPSRLTRNAARDRTPNPEPEIREPTSNWNPKPGTPKPPDPHHCSLATVRGKLLSWRWKHETSARGCAVTGRGSPSWCCRWLLHLVGLGDRSYHHDEAIHAHASYNLLENGIYRYDPTYHGPLLYYLTAATYRGRRRQRLHRAAAGGPGRGPADRRRLVPAATVRCARRLVDGAARDLVAHVLYYGRFLRMDVLEMLTASAAAVAAWRALRGSTVGLAVGRRVDRPRLRHQGERLRHGGPGGGGLVGHDRPAPWRAASRWRSALVLRPPRLAAGGVAWRWRCWSRCPCSPSASPIPRTGSSPARRSPTGGVSTRSARVAGPWWYHLPRLALYEFLPIVAAMAWVVRRRRRLTAGRDRALSCSACCRSSMYGYLREKVPWLGVAPGVAVPAARRGPAGAHVRSRRPLVEPHPRRRRPRGDRLRSRGRQLRLGRDLAQSGPTSRL